MWYVYFLKSIKKQSYTYTGYTNNLERRLEEHNSENSKLSTANYRPFELISYIGIKNLRLAVNLERYFKTGSGRAFLKRHLL
ncbi:MAG: GIY-YIG nuclease family protein [Candidatus Omnitrophota bacterium]